MLYFKISYSITRKNSIQLLIEKKSVSIVSAAHFDMIAIMQLHNAQLVKPLIALRASEMGVLKA